MSEETATLPQPPPSPMARFTEFLKTCDRGILVGTIVAIAGFALAFWPLLKELPAVWLGYGSWKSRSGDGYYSHGLLVPLISGYIIYRRWDRIKETPVKAGWIALVPILALLVVLKAADNADIQQIRSFALLGIMMSAIWLTAGWKWMWALSPATLYLLFALPIWTSFIDSYTNPLQITSTTVAYHLLEMIGYSPFQTSPTEILLNSFTLTIAVACSGMKLLVAVSAFTIFFMLIASLKWWANLVMMGLVVPLCLFINGLRIALIGVVGEENGATAAHSFHDYSGYITLVVCFFILFKIARWLGWKD